MANIVWTTITGAKISVEGVGAATDVLDTTASSTAGMNLSGLDGFAVYVEADSGQTITTAISLRAYAQDPYSGRWARAPDWDISNTFGVTGIRSQYMAGFSVDSPAGRVGYEPSAGAVSSGSLHIRIIATGGKGELV